VRTFCGQCGTALTYRRLDLPASVDLTLGSMDDPEQLEPQDHTWTESKLSWIRLADDLPAYPQERPTKRNGRSWPKRPAGRFDPNWSKTAKRCWCRNLHGLPPLRSRIIWRTLPSKSANARQICRSSKL